MVLGAMQCMAIFNTMINIGFSINTMRKACTLIITSNRLDNIHPSVYNIFDCLICNRQNRSFYRTNMCTNNVCHRIIRLITFRCKICNTDNRNRPNQICSACTFIND
jgi:hypothetical protein